MKCPRCGADNEEGRASCWNCYADMSKPPEAFAKVPAPPSWERKAPAPPPPQARPGVPAPPGPGAPPPPPGGPPSPFPPVGRPPVPGAPPSPFPPTPRPAPYAPARERVAARRSRTGTWITLAVIVVVLGGGFAFAWFKTSLPIIIKCGFPPTIEGKKSRWVLSSDGVLAIPCPVGWKKEAMPEEMPIGVPGVSGPTSGIAVLRPTKAGGSVMEESGTVEAIATPLRGTPMAGKSLDDIVNQMRAESAAAAARLPGMPSMGEGTWTKVGRHKAWVMEMGMMGFSTRLYLFVVGDKLCMATFAGAAAQEKALDEIAKHVRVLK